MKRKIETVHYYFDSTLILDPSYPAGSNPTNEYPIRLEFKFLK